MFPENENPFGWNSDAFNSFNDRNSGYSLSDTFSNNRNYNVGGSNINSVENTFGSDSKETEPSTSSTSDILDAYDEGGELVKNTLFDHVLPSHPLWNIWRPFNEWIFHQIWDVTKTKKSIELDEKNEKPFNGSEFNNNTPTPSNLSTGATYDPEGKPYSFSNSNGVDDEIKNLDGEIEELRKYLKSRDKHRPGWLSSLFYPGKANADDKERARLEELLTSKVNDLAEWRRKRVESLANIETNKRRYADEKEALEKVGIKNPYFMLRNGPLGAGAGSISIRGTSSKSAEDNEKKNPFKELLPLLMLLKMIK